MGITPRTHVIPNEDGHCQVCGQSPTVAFELNGLIVHNTKLCGNCYFGTVKTLDSSKFLNWIILGSKCNENIMSSPE